MSNVNRRRFINFSIKKADAGEASYRFDACSAYIGSV